MWITFQMQWTLLINTDTGVVGGGGGGFKASIVKLNSV